MLSSVLMDIHELLNQIVSRKGSDLHLSPNNPPLIRIDGEIEELSTEIVTNDKNISILETIKSGFKLEEFKEHKEMDFSISTEDSRFRVNAFWNGGGISLVLRTIPSRVLTLEDLDPPRDVLETFRKLCNMNKGMVLVTGMTGSGKSTTLAAMIDYINSTRREHILTIEDPVEFVHQRKKCLISQREVGRDTNSFQNALRASLREDPDIILVGEMRDLETIRLALTAAETGHLVFGTLHTTSAAKTIDRIIDVFPTEEKDMIRTMLSESLNAVISQNLLRRKGSGRVAAHEIMVCNSAIKNLIRENKVAQMYSTIQTGSKEGMITMDQSLKRLVLDGVIEPETARVIAKLPEDFK